MKDVFRGTGLYRGMFIFFLFVSVFEALLASLVILLFKDALMSLYGGSAFWLAVTALVLMSIIASVFSTYLTVKRIYFPLVKLDEAMEKVSGGDYSVRLPIEEKGDYEADIIMRKSHEYFNRMAEELSSVELKSTPEVLKVEVSDDGQGIEESAMRHIFDRFYQGDGSHKAEGNGPGLTIAKRVVDLMEGEIFAENLPEKGCKFTVKLKK